MHVFVFYFSLLSSLSSLTFLFSLSCSFFVGLMRLDTTSGSRSDGGGFDRGGSDGGWGWLRSWVELVEAVGWRSGLRPWVKVRIGDPGWGKDRGCWGGGFCVSLWWVFAAVCVVGFYFLFIFYFGGWGLRLWLVVVAVAVAMVRGDELEKLRPWRFWEQISEGGRSFTRLRKMERQWESEK